MENVVNVACDAVNLYLQAWLAQDVIYLVYSFGVRVRFDTVASAFNCVRDSDAAPNW